MNTNGAGKEDLKGDDRIQGRRSDVADGKKIVESFLLHSYGVSEIGLAE